MFALSSGLEKKHSAAGRVFTYHEHDEQKDQRTHRQRHLLSTCPVSLLPAQTRLAVPGSLVLRTALPMPID